MNWRKKIPVFLLIIGWFLIGWFGRGLLLSQGDQELALLRQARQVITREFYGDLPSPRQLTYAAIRAMLHSLGDKYAVFFEPPLAARQSIELRGNDAVTGLKGEMQEGTFVITNVFSGEPADRAGLQAGDVLVEVDGWKVKPDSTYMEVSSMIRGPLGSTAHLVVRRGDKALEFDVPRKPPQDVITQTIGADIAYLRVDRFTEKTPQEVKQALESLLATGPKGLIWDLRYNGGGLMNPTQEVLDFFLEEGVAFYARTKDGTLIPYNTTSGDMAEKIPLVVLIGPNTYSAPETAAASIADRGHGTLIGETTHGKGMINTTVPLFDGSSIQVSVAESLSPVHRECYEGKGVQPHILVKQDQTAQNDSVLQYAVDYLQRKSD